MLNRSYSITWTPASFAESMIAPPEPVSRLTSTITPAPSAMACSACDCCVSASFSALTIVCSTPASVNALSKYGRSSVSHRGDEALSGRSTQMVLSQPPPPAAASPPPVSVAAPSSSSPPQPAATRASAATSPAITKSQGRSRPDPVDMNENLLTSSSLSNTDDACSVAGTLGGLTAVFKPGSSNALSAALRIYRAADRPILSRTRESVRSGAMATEPGTSGGVRELNRLRVVDALRRGGTTSRSELARLTGLSRTTVASARRRPTGARASSSRRRRTTRARPRRGEAGRLSYCG